MNERESLLKAYLGVSLLLALDLSRFFDYSLKSEFVFLGVLFASLNLRPSPAVGLAAVFGYCRDAFAGPGLPLYTLEFAAIAAAIQFFRFAFIGQKERFLLILAALALHALLASLRCGKVFIGQIVFFLSQSILFYFAVSFLLKKWLKIFPENSL